MCSCFSGLKMLEIHQEIDDQQGHNTVPDTSNINKSSPTKMNNQLRKIKLPHNQTMYNQTTQNKHYLKRIINSEKTTLTSLRNIEWRTI